MLSIKCSSFPCCNIWGDIFSDAWIQACLVLHFTVPNATPEVSISWISLTEMLVEWKPLTLEEARGFIASYTVTYGPVDSLRRKRATETVTVSGDQTSVSIGDLDPNTEYSVSVAATTKAGMGDGSEPIVPPSEPSLLINY